MAVGAAALCIVVLAGSIARAADSPKPSPADQKALKELRAVMQSVDPPNTMDERGAYLRTLSKKLGTFAEEHKTDLGGAQALMIVAQISLQLGESQAAIKAVDTLIERYPKLPALPDAKFVRAAALMRLDRFDDAKAALLAMQKDYPDYPGKQRVAMMLKQVEMQQLVGKPAADFRTKKLDGAAITLSDLGGKVVLLDFFAGWCGPCRAEMPSLLALYARNRTRGFEILGVSLDRTLADAKKFVEAANIPWIVTWEEPGFWKNPVAVAYGVQSIPTTYLLDTKGTVIEVNVRGSALRKAMAKLFPPTPAEQQTKHNLQEIAKATHAWAHKFGKDDYYPPSLSELATRGILTDPKVFVSPATGTKPVAGRVVTDFGSALDRAGYKLHDTKVSRGTMLAWEKKPSFGDGRYVVRFDVQIAYLPGPAFETALKQLDRIIEENRPEEK
jgi:peroxiredoxin